MRETVRVLEVDKKLGRVRKLLGRSEPDGTLVTGQNAAPRTSRAVKMPGRRHPLRGSR